MKRYFIVGGACLISSLIAQILLPVWAKEEAISASWAIGLVFGILFSFSSNPKRISTNLLFAVTCGIVNAAATVIHTEIPITGPHLLEIDFFQLNGLVAGGFGSVSLYAAYTLLYTRSPGLLFGVIILAVGGLAGSMFLAAPLLSPYIPWQVSVGLLLFGSGSQRKIEPARYGPFWERFDAFIEGRTGRIPVMVAAIAGILIFLINVPWSKLLGSL